MHPLFKPGVKFLLFLFSIAWLTMAADWSVQQVFLPGIHSTYMGTVPDESIHPLVPGTWEEYIVTGIFLYDLRPSHRR